ncbi:transcription factor Ouib isoform X1 [Drosophila tropicalis]|uniref:transcription factor Ouib isoform X1 n=1 Tax=Drosophila tropicalis TaxID=46794 RepID=UPI0035AB9BFE
MSKATLKQYRNTCRVCGKYASIKRSPKLFDWNNTKLIDNIETLTGIRLENHSCLPDLICECCNIELAGAIKLRERCILAQRELLMGLSEEQIETISPQYRAIILGGILDDETSHLQEQQLETEKPCEEEELDNNEIILKEEVADMKIIDKDEFDNEFLEVSEVGDIIEGEIVTTEEIIQEPEDDANSLIEEAEYEYMTADELDVAETEASVDQIIVADSTDAYVYDSDDEVAVLDNVLDDEYEHENSVVKKSSLPPKPKVKPDDPRRRGAGGLYICDQCGNHVKGRMAFELHCRRHRGDKQFACEICANRFCTTSELKRHMRKHTGERPFACQYCGRCFTDYTTRVKHERTHTNERPYACGTCGKAFTTGYILKNHMLIHSGERAYRCELCDKSFMLPTHLSTHFRSGVHKRHVEKAEMEQKLELKMEMDDDHLQVQD